MRPDEIVWDLRMIEWHPIQKEEGGGGRGGVGSSASSCSKECCRNRDWPWLYTPIGLCSNLILDMQIGQLQEFVS